MLSLMGIQLNKDASSLWAIFGLFVEFQDTLAFVTWKSRQNLPSPLCGFSSRDVTFAHNLKLHKLA